MDNAVALVQAYLRVNGYFTVAEYPVVEATRQGEYRTATDLDLLAFRFASAGRLIPAPGRHAGGDREGDRFAPDPALGVADASEDMIVCEVKEGRAELNPAATHPAVLRAALVRFGCCPREAADGVVEQLLRQGQALLPNGHLIRMVVFGSTQLPGATGSYTVVRLGHVVEFLEQYLRDNWEVLRHEDQKDPALGFLAMLEKIRRAPS